ncbi:MAG: hypothetical protein JJT82_01205 [Legionellaceae bacterium]|nr:hypothetical protein [Legionellaceae bacterium]
MADRPKQGSTSAQAPDFCRFYGLLNLQQILDKRLNENPKAQTSPRTQGLFHQSASLNHPDAQEQKQEPQHQSPLRRTRAPLLVATACGRREAGDGCVYLLSQYA